MVKKKKSKFKLSKSDKTFGIKNSSWKKSFLIAVILLVTIFVLEQTRLYFADRQLENDYEELVKIPSGWKLTNSELLGDPYCNFGDCRRLNRSFNVNTQSSTNDVFKEFYKLNKKQFSGLGKSCSRDILDQRCVSPTIENENYRIWISLSSENENNQSSLKQANIGLQIKQ